MTSTAQKVKWLCTNVAKTGFDISRGVLWQTRRRNAKEYYFPRGELIAQRRSASGFQTDALYLYPDESMLIVNRVVNRTANTTKLEATKGKAND